MEIEFENDAAPLVSDYFLEADFGNGSSLPFVPFSSECPVRVSGHLEANGDKIKLGFTNDGYETGYVDSFELRWPAINGAIEKVKWDGHTYVDELKPALSLSVDATQFDLSDRKIDPGHTEYLEVQFVDDVDPLADRYEIQADFGGDCSLVFVPNGSGAAGVTPYDFSYVIYADVLHAQGITGDGVTVAVVDTGVWPESRIKKDRHDDDRIVAEYNAIEDEQGKGKAKDRNGHGTHVASLVSNSERWNNSLFAGVAPDVNLVAVQGFDEEGRGRYGDVIRALDWILQNKDLYDIRVVNLSFSAEPRSYYWDDPLNQAVMALWDAGIVVVASAGNSGPDPMTVGVPGNIPYVITVGAMSDAVTPENYGDDFLASFSATGPTYEGFVKPEIVAPGGHLRGVMDKKGRIAEDHPNFHDRGKYFTMSGTSQAAAVTSGVVALMLQADPSLGPDEVKCRLMASARPAIAADGSLAYSVFQQGAGMVAAYDAVYSNDAGCANRGLDIDKDLAGIEHYRGRANQSADGFLWSDGFMWSNSLTETLGINVWVEQE